MAHHLVAGMTMSGKSSLAFMQCRALRRQGHFTIALDPRRDPKWAAHIVTKDPAALLWFVKNWNPAEHNGQTLRVWIDEGAEALGRDCDFNWLATQSRHHGTVCFFLSQSPQDFQPAIRRNCHHLWLFACDGSAVKPLAQEWNAPELLDVVKFPQCQFKYARRFSDPLTGRIDFAKDSILWLPPTGSPRDSTAGGLSNGSVDRQKGRGKKCAR